MSTDSAPLLPAGIVTLSVDADACRCNCKLIGTLSSCIHRLSFDAFPLTPLDIDHARAIRAVLIQYRTPAINRAAIDWLTRVELLHSFQSTASQKSIKHKRATLKIAHGALMGAIHHAICYPSSP